LEFPGGLADRLCAYAISVAHFPTALKEFEVCMSPDSPNAPYPNLIIFIFMSVVLMIYIFTVAKWILL
jgi:hypothetical protein